LIAGNVELGVPAPSGASGLITQKSVRIIGIDCPCMIQPKLPMEKSAAPPSVSTLDDVVNTDPPTDHSHWLRRKAMTLVVSSNPPLCISPTFLGSPGMAPAAR
jgi:hypothetical protein